MVVAGECLPDTPVLHDREADAIRQRPGLVGALAVEFQAAGKPRVKGGDDGGAGIDREPLQKLVRSLADGRRRQGIGHFHEDPAGGHNTGRQCLGRCHGRGVKAVGRVQ